MNGHQRKTMPRIQLDRIGDDVVITRGGPGGDWNSITMPLDQALILADWITEAAEDHDGAATPEPHPSPAEEAETGRSGGCTRTRDVIAAWATFACTMFDLSPIEKAVLTAMASWSDDSWRCRLPVKAIAEQANVDRKSVFEALDRLKSAILIQDTGERDGQTRQVVVYQLCGAPVSKWPPLPKIIDPAPVAAIGDGEVRRS